MSERRSSSASTWRQARSLRVADVAVATLMGLLFVRQGGVHGIQSILPLSTKQGSEAAPAGIGLPLRRLGTRVRA